jgi:CubicO group peptidase (beta-lactamase class C family)
MHPKASHGVQKIARVALMFLASTLVISSTAFAADTFASEATDPVAAGMDAARLERIPVRMQSYVDQGTAAGFVTIVVRHGHVATLKAVGYQDREARLPMRTDSIFRIASMTKPLTVAGVMILVDEARLSLLDPVEQYLPEFKGIKVSPCGEPQPRAGCDPVKAARPITVLDLVTHTSGLPGEVPPGAKPYKSLAEEVRAGAQGLLLAQPGTKWIYSNLGYSTLGRLIEVCSGLPYEDFMAERLFRPLGMKDTSFFLSPEKQRRLAVMYTLDDAGKLVRAAPDAQMAPKFPRPAGGGLSTASDMARFHQMLMNKGTLNGKRVLSAAAVAAMIANQTGDLKDVEFSPGLGMGLGFGIVKDAVGTFRYQSLGTFAKGGAYRTYGWGDPAKDLLGIIMYQRTNGGGDMAPETTAFVTLANAAIER